MFLCHYEEIKKNNHGSQGKGRKMNACIESMAQIESYIAVFQRQINQLITGHCQAYIHGKKKKKKKS